METMTTTASLVPAAELASERDSLTTTLNRRDVLSAMNGPMHAALQAALYLADFCERVTLVVRVRLGKRVHSRRILATRAAGIPG